jgi:hypothetical protein
MSAAEYTALESLPLADLLRRPFWQLINFMERCDRARRLVILQAMTPKQ